MATPLNFCRGIRYALFVLCEVQLDNKSCNLEYFTCINT